MDSPSEDRVGTSAASELKLMFPHTSSFQWEPLQRFNKDLIPTRPRDMASSHKKPRVAAEPNKNQPKITPRLHKSRQPKKKTLPKKPSALTEYNNTYMAICSRIPTRPIKVAPRRNTPVQPVPRIIQNGN